MRTADPEWLDDEEQEAWRAFVHGSTQVIRLLERDLLDRHDLSIDDYGLLAKLSEAPDERLRFGDLADVLHLPKANLTYRFKRLEAAGLVQRLARWRAVGANGGLIVVRLSNAYLFPTAGETQKPPKSGSRPQSTTHHFEQPKSAKTGPAGDRVRALLGVLERRERRLGLAP